MTSNLETEASALLTKGGSPLFFQACVGNFSESPLQLLEKIKNFFNETKNLLKKDRNIFSKNCSNTFAQCSSQSKHEGARRGGVKRAGVEG